MGTDIDDEQERMVRKAYLEEIVNQATIADLGRQEINAQLPLEHRDRDMDRLFVGMQILINAAAMISKLLWPDGKAFNRDYGHMTRHRVDYLHQVVGVSDQSALKDRAIRDALEHFDERMDRWINEEVQSGRSVVYADRLLGSPSTIIVDGEEYRPLRYIDPDTEGIRVGVLDDAITLQPLFDEILQIANEARQELSNVKWP